MDFVLRLYNMDITLTIETTSGKIRLTLDTKEIFYVYEIFKTTHTLYKRKCGIKLTNGDDIVVYRSFNSMQRYKKNSSKRIGFNYPNRK